jgi:hypothetical protein
VQDLGWPLLEVPLQAHRPSEQNRRMGLAIRNLDRMDKNKLEDHLAIAEKFLQGLQ